MNCIKDLVSIVVPVYNAEKFLGQTLGCLEGQTYKNIEVILVDDGSSDSSKVICEGYAVRDGRFRYYYQENAGAGAARNHGIDLARGEFLMFLDSDDLFEYDFVEKMHGAIVGSEADVAVCRGDKFNSVYEPSKAQPIRPQALLDPDVYVPEEIGQRFFQVMTLSPWDKIFRVEHVKNNGLRFQNLRYSNDTYFVLMALLAASKIVVTADVLVHYRCGHGDSLRDKMYLNPYCDLVAIDALRIGFGETEMVHSKDLCYSLDAFSADFIISSCMKLASQSESACKDFTARLKEIDVPGLKDLLKRPFSGEGLRRACKYWAVTTAPAEGISWAVSILGINGWRRVDSLRAQIVWFRVLVSPVVVGWRRMRKSAN